MANPKLNFLDPLLHESAERLDKMRSRFPNIAHFEVSAGEHEEVYIHAVVSPRIEDGDRRREFERLAYEQIALCFPKREFIVDPEIVDHPHEAARTALEIYGRDEFKEMLARLENMPAHFKRTKPSETARA